MCNTVVFGMIQDCVTITMARNAKLFCIEKHHVSFPPAVFEDTNFSTSLSTLTII